MTSFGWFLRQQVRRLLRRAFDEPARKSTERRIEECKPRIRPVMLAPSVDGQPAQREAQFAITSDITSRGLAAFVSQPITTGSAFVGLHLDGEPHLLLARVRSTAKAGGGFHRIGMEFMEIVDPTIPGIDTLRSLAVQLSLTAPQSRRSKEALEEARRSLFEALKSMGISND